jgi:transcriptional regulator with XRE-family HTH domain
MTDESNPLGAFLRARRELVDPSEHGIRDVGRRRVPGLRREELAFLAGVSAPYYARLEQGRDRSPSPSVLAAIAAALRLDADALDHLDTLAAATPPRKRRPDRPVVVPAAR